MTRILIIDSDSATSAMMKTILSGEARSISTAHDGKTGIQLLKDHPFDVVITNILLPERDGFEVIMEIMKMSTKPRVVAMIGDSFHLSREYMTAMAKAFRVDHLLYKPFSISQLQESVAAENCSFKSV